MTSRERVRKAIHFRGPDRIPHYLPDSGENDILWLWPPRLPPKQDWTNRGDTDWMTDEWGAVRYRAAGGVYGFGEVHTPPIPDITRQAEYVFPELNAPERFDDWRRQIAENAALANPKYVLGVYSYGFFERYVQRMIATLGSHNGGLISKTYPTPQDVHHDPAKIAAACAAFRRHGVYDGPAAKRQP
jgi:hypothetical protein